MASQFGNFVAGITSQGRRTVLNGSWTLLSANGTNNLSRRAFIKVQYKGRGGLALRYVNVDNTIDGLRSFTTPTANTETVKSAVIYPRGAIFVEPLGEDVALFARVTGKAGANDSSGVAVVVEYA